MHAKIGVSHAISLVGVRLVGPQVIGEINQNQMLSEIDAVHNTYAYACVVYFVSECACMFMANICFV